MKSAATIQPEEFYHFGITRPEVRFRKDAPDVREVHWPTTDFLRSDEPTLTRDVIVGIGIEPHLKWQTFCGHILDLARRAQVSLVITLGALLADVPHTRPIRISGVASDPELRRRFQTTQTRRRAVAAGLHARLRSDSRPRGAGRGEPPASMLPD